MRRYFDQHPKTRSWYKAQKDDKLKLQYVERTVKQVAKGPPSSSSQL